MHLWFLLVIKFNFYLWLNFRMLLHIFLSLFSFLLGNFFLLNFIFLGQYVFFSFDLTKCFEILCLLLDIVAIATYIIEIEVVLLDADELIKFFLVGYLREETSPFISLSKYLRLHSISQSTMLHMLLSLNGRATQ